MTKTLTLEQMRAHYARAMDWAWLTYTEERTREGGETYTRYTTHIDEDLWADWDVYPDRVEMHVERYSYTEDALDTETWNAVAYR